MSNHGPTVKIETKVLELNNAGSAVTFEIFNDAGKLGTIPLGKGSFRWKAASKKNYKSMDWTEFCEKLNEIM